MNDHVILKLNKVLSQFGEICGDVETYTDSIEALQRVQKEDNVFRFDILTNCYEATYIYPHVTDYDSGKLLLKIDLNGFSLSKIALIIDAIEHLMDSNEFKEAM